MFAQAAPTPSEHAALKAQLNVPSEGARLHETCNKVECELARSQSCEGVLVPSESHGQSLVLRFKDKMTKTGEDTRRDLKAFQFPVGRGFLRGQ